MLNGHVSRSGPLTPAQQHKVHTALNQGEHLTSSVSPMIDIYAAHLEDDEALLPPEDTFSMTIETGPHQLASSDGVEPTQKLVAEAREKYIQRWQRHGKQAQSILSPTYDLSVVVPTRNEHDNIWRLLESLQDALHGLCVEVIFVDDSDDDTPEVIKHAVRTMSSPLFHIQLEHRFA